MNKRLAGGAVFAAVSVLGSLVVVGRLPAKPDKPGPAIGRQAPMSWETLDHSRPIRLMPFGVVCRTIALVDVVGDAKSYAGCMMPREGQVVHIEWLGQGDGEAARYQHVRARFGRTEFVGWTLGLDLTND